MSKEMPNGIDKKTVKQMDASQKMDVLVDYVAALGENINGLRDEIKQNKDNRQDYDEERREYCQRRWFDYCNPRFEKLEHFKWQALGIVGGLALIGTIVGPIVAAWLGSSI